MLIGFAIAFLGLIFAVKSGVFGLSVEEKAKVLRPFAYNMLSKSKPAGFLGLGGSVTIQARALIAWSAWKYGYDSPDAKAWRIATEWARDKLNDERQDPVRFVEQIALLVSTFVGAIVGGPAGLAAWGAYIGTTAVREAERNSQLRKAYRDFINANVRARDTSYNEFIRFLYCTTGAASYWISHGPSREAVAECARLAIIDEPARAGYVAINGEWRLPGGSLRG